MIYKTIRVSITRVLADTLFPVRLAAHALISCLRAVHLLKLSNWENMCLLNNKIY